MKFVFKRDDLVAAGWTLSNESSGEVKASHDFIEPGIGLCTARMTLQTVGDTLQFVPTKLIEDEMRSVFKKTNTRYLGVA